jgi:SAM-dependent methyltransferase
VLDAGCGTGRNLLELAALGTVEGVDASVEALELCRSRGITAVRQGKVEELPFDDGSFDLIVATDVVEHLLDDRAALRELRRVAAPGARLLATVPAYGWLWSAHDNDHHHYRRYTLRQLRTRVDQAGWDTVTASYFNSLLLMPIAAVRLLQSRRPVEPDARPDLELTPRALNRLLAQPMRIEAALIERGWSLPAGVSIGLVAVAGGGR